MGLKEGDYEGATEAYEGALAIARSTGVLALEMGTTAASSHSDYWHFRWQETVEKGLAVIKMAQRADDLQAEYSARQWAVVALLGMGQADIAEPHVRSMMDTAEKMRDRYQLATALWFSEMIAISKGDWQAARALNERGLSVSPFDARLLGTRLVIEFETGNTQDGVGYLEQAIAAYRLLPAGARYDHASTALMIPVAARITGDMDLIHIAEGAAATILNSDSPTLLVCRFARFGLGMIAVSTVTRTAQINSTQSWNQFAVLSSDRVLGLLAQTMGNLDQAAVYFEEALRSCRDAGYRPELVYSSYDYAALLDRNNREDREKAIGLLNESLSIAHNLRMPPLIEQAKVLQEQVESGPVKAPAYPEGLTQREVEVIKLVAAGRTDREIGEELFISIKTVGNHVSNILNKTGAANRTEAATFAARHGLD